MSDDLDVEGNLVIKFTVVRVSEAVARPCACCGHRLGYHTTRGCKRDLEDGRRCQCQVGYDLSTEKPLKQP